MFWNSKREERRDDRAAQAMVDFSDDVKSAAVRWYVFVQYGLALTVIWIVVLLIPKLISAYLSFAMGSKLLLMPVAIVFGLSMYLAYAVAAQLTPNLEENKTLDNNVFESDVYQESANRRIKVWMAAILFGVANTGAMILAALLLDAYGLYLFEI
ncbi:MAG: hypothetical protein OEM82_14955 [Acidobacteriota bacterium]|nr:hypothetical protein [Acidobacteriota bacterium]